MAMRVYTVTDTVRSDTKHETTVHFKPAGRRWHKRSEFGDGTRKPLSREQRAQWNARVRMLRQPRGLTQAAAGIGQAMVNMLGPNGRLDPTQAHLAKVARVSLATCKRALNMLKAAGLITWTRRLIRRGWRTEQTSNAYVLHTEAHFQPQVFKREYTKRNQTLTRQQAAQTTLADTARTLTGEERGGPRPSNLTDAEAIANRDRQIRLLTGA